MIGGTLNVYVHIVIALDCKSLLYYMVNQTGCLTQVFHLGLGLVVNSLELHSE